MAIFSGRATGAFGGTIRFDWAPDPEVVSMELIETAERLEDRSGPLALAREVAIDEHLDHFKSQSGPDGEAWRPWSRSYEPVARVHNVGEILERTMTLEQAMANPAAYPITQDSVFFSTGGLPEYWLWNQEGTGSFMNWGFIDEQRERHEVAKSLGMGESFSGSFGIGSGQALPARPFVGMSVEAQLKIIEIFDLWFDNVVTTTFQRGGKFVLAGMEGGRFTSRQIVV